MYEFLKPLVWTQDGSRVLEVAARTLLVSLSTDTRQRVESFAHAAPVLIKHAIKSFSEWQRSGRKVAET